MKIIYQQQATAAFSMLLLS